MAARESPDNLVEVGRAYSVLEADMLCEALRAAEIAAISQGTMAANTLSHMAGGLNPRGLPILVGAPAAAEARRLIEEWAERNNVKRQADQAKGIEQPQGVQPDQWARAAWHSAILATVMPLPFAPVSFYNILRANREAIEIEPDDEIRFRRDLRKARWALGSVTLFYGSLLLLAIGSLSLSFCGRDILYLLNLLKESIWLSL